MPLLYAVSFWLAWPTLSRLRRAEMRAESSKALHKLRRESVTQQRLLEGELVVTLGDADATAGTLQHQTAFAAPAQRRVSLTHQGLVVDGTPPICLLLTTTSDPQLRGALLSVEGTLCTVAENADHEKPAKLTLALPPSDARSGGWTLRNPLRHGGSGPSLREWQSAISGQMPMPEHDAQDELRQLHLAPVIWPYELRCFWWELFECLRKLCLVGLPVFFEPGSAEQLMFGLLICFLTITIFAIYRPMRDALDDHLQILCLIEVFLALLSAVSLRYERSAFSEEDIGLALVILLFLPLLFALCYELRNERICRLLRPSTRGPMDMLSQLSMWLRERLGSGAEARGSVGPASLMSLAPAPASREYVPGPAEDTGSSFSFAQITPKMPRREAAAPAAPEERPEAAPRHSSGQKSCSLAELRKTEKGLTFAERQQSGAGLGGACKDEAAASAGGGSAGRARFSVGDVGVAKKFAKRITRRLSDDGGLAEPSAHAELRMTLKRRSVMDSMSSRPERCSRQQGSHKSRDSSSEVKASVTCDIEEARSPRMSTDIASPACTSAAAQPERAIPQPLPHARDSPPQQPEPRSCVFDCGGRPALLKRQLTEPVPLPPPTSGNNRAVRRASLPAGPQGGPQGRRKSAVVSV